MAIHHLAQQQGPPVAKLRREAPELVPRIDLRQRRGPVGHRVAGEYIRIRPAGDAQLRRQRIVPRDHARRGHAGRHLAGKKPGRQRGIAVIEWDVQRHGNLFFPALSGHRG